MGMIIFLLPNMVTACGLLCGFYSIVLSVSALEGGSNFLIPSALAILFAALFDVLDGRIARIMRTTTRFGKEFDSLSDLVSFGIAPALLLYVSYLHRFGFIGFVVSFVYLLAGAMRLARFNLMQGSTLRFSKGLVVPVPAVFIASLIIFEKSAVRYEVPLALPLIPVTLILSYLMVSNIRYRIFKDLQPTIMNIKPILILLSFITGLALIFNPALIFLILLSIYIISGIVQDILVKSRNKRKDIFFDWEELLSTFYSEEEVAMEEDTPLESAEE